MGVNGLYSALEPAREQFSAREHLVQCAKCPTTRLRVAVDMSSWVVVADRPRHNSDHHTAAYNVVFARLRLLIQNGLQPICVFDGPRLGQASVGSRDSRISRGICKKVATQFGCPVVLAHGDAEAMCATLSRTGHADAVITTGSDALVYGAVMVLKQRSTAYQLDPNDIKFDMYTAIGIQKAVSWLSGADLQAQLVLLALINGCSYYEGVTGCSNKAVEALYEALREWRCSPEKLVHELMQGNGGKKLLAELDMR
jgi:hypothetical protein